MAGSDSDPVVTAGRSTLIKAASFKVPEDFLLEDLDQKSCRDLLGGANRPSTLTLGSSFEDHGAAAQDPAEDVSDDDEEEAGDETLRLYVLFEPPVPGGRVLSPDGLRRIADHEYRPSEYSVLDNLLNPTWTYLTELLPMWLAPNMVTTLGGLHCAVAYGILWWHCPDFDRSPPDWVVAFAGWCTIAYYTLDCMDGKQARRTGSSSPLGQLFDHGFDCLCTLFFMSTVASYLMIGGTYWYTFLQTALNLSFFMAQWEEYCTHILPHCVGGWIGVTEVNYSVGLYAFAASVVDRERVFKMPVGERLPFLSGHLPAVIENMEFRHLIVGYHVWLMFVVLIPMSIYRVMTHPNITAGYPIEVRQNRLSALSKLVTPMALCGAAALIPPEAVRTRFVSVTLGLAFSLLTKKIIVFSMAKMPYAAVQWEAVPFLVVAVWIRYDHRLTKEGANLVLGMLCFWYAFRLIKWAKVAIDQICEKLGIYVLTITKKKDD